MAHYMGMDGGGTKTAFVVIDDTRRVLARTRRPSCDWFAPRVDAIEAHIRDGVADVLERAGLVPDDIELAFLGIPGHGEDGERLPVLDATARRALGHDRFRCGNDMLSGWAGSLGGADGINVVAGTGSIAYGERDGLSARAGGWGEIFGDEGSGHWIAVRALTAFGRMSDGRLERTLLHERLRERLGIQEDLDAIGLVLTRWEGSRSRVADLATAVTAAAAEGDPTAARILDDAAAELVLLARALADSLGVVDGERIAVATSGGVISAPLVRDRFAAALAADARLELVPSQEGPEVGAAICAQRMAAADERVGCARKDSARPSR
ncbi:N-acetylglucosamine kinase [Brachybacterium huguangmaarense]